MNKTYLTYEQIERNKTKTVILLAFMLIVVLAASLIVGYTIEDIWAGVIYGLSFSIIVFSISLMISKFTIMFSTKGKQVDINSDEGRRLYKMVENLAAAAGIPNPEIYIIPTDAPNAFASGLSPKTSFIGVTQGLLDKMDDHEIEGVLAHEISHIANRDVLIATVAYAIVTIFIVLSSLRYIRIRDKRGNNDGGAFIIIVILLIGLIGQLLAKLLDLAISRKREYIADANAVRLCADNNGLISALTKLSKIKYTDEEVYELGGPHLLGMYINGSAKSFSKLFSTHPPIEERIEILKNMG